MMRTQYISLLYFWCKYFKCTGYIDSTTLSVEPSPGFSAVEMVNFLESLCAYFFLLPFFFSLATIFEEILLAHGFFSFAARPAEIIRQTMKSPSGHSRARLKIWSATSWESLINGHPQSSFFRRYYCLKVAGRRETAWDRDAKNKEWKGR